MKSYQIFLFILFIRVLSVFLVRTWYVPDEYWQSLEVGHKLAFGYGHLTWEWAKGIRSYVPPALVALLYKILEYFELDTVELLTILPRVFQAILTSYADFCFYKWTGKSKWGLFVLLSSWFWFYTGSRTLANTLETTLTMIALSKFPWHSENTDFLWFISIAAFLRPTAIIPWIPLCIYHLTKSKYSALELFFKRYFLIGFVIGIFFTAIDCFMHGSFVFTPLEFLKVNVLKDIGSFYGTHPAYWYFNVGLPTILGIGTIPFLFSIIETIRKGGSEMESRKVLLVSILLTMFVYSALPHKEFRFMLQILPMCLYMITDLLSKWSRRASKWILWLAAIILLAGNAVPAGYLSHVHQRGTIDVMPALANIARTYKDEINQSAKIFFMMPCHSTPYYSHIHYNVTMRFLTCEPNLKGVENYQDEADQFYVDPMKWIRSHLPVHPRSALPSHVVVFDILAPRISDFLSIYNPREVFFHSDYASGRVGRNVIIYERFDPTAIYKTTPEPSVKEEPQIEEKPLIEAEPEGEAPSDIVQPDEIK